MMNPIRVLIVDDSAVARGMITTALSEHTGIEVVGSAANGAIALSKLPKLMPEAVILDIEMPEMDGLTALKHIREQYPKLAVIMFSTLSEHGARATFEALTSGANDYALKPSGSSGESIQDVARKVLVPKLFALTRPMLAMPTRPSEPSTPAPKTGQHNAPPARGMTRPSAPARPSVLPPERPTRNPPGGSQRPSARASMTPSAVRPSLTPGPHSRPRLVPKLIAIASSTGGPNALIEIIPHLPKDFPVPVVIVQHMPPIFTRHLAERLDGCSHVKVIESAGNELLKPGMVYVAPGNRHLELVRDLEGVKTVLNDAPPENSCRPAADVLFRSVARVYGPNALCVVLTGMGTDGLLGAREIARAGGRILAQSGPTCVVWGMPKAVEQAGLCEAIVPLPELGVAIAQRVLGVAAVTRSLTGG
jgi:two-component system chemotaxis response regulator CheB